jgi:hypothetical protein
VRLMHRVVFRDGLMFATRWAGSLACDWREVGAARQDEIGLGLEGCGMRSKTSGHELHVHVLYIRRYKET